MGVRGIKLAQGDTVISMAILDHIEASTSERDAYLRHAGILRRAEEGEAIEASALEEARFEALRGREEFLLSIANDGFGKRSSAYEYRTTGRGGQGIEAIDLRRSKGSSAPEVVGLFPVTDADQLMLVTDAGKLIRLDVSEIRLTGRKARGVTLFRVAEDERIVSVARLEDAAEDESDQDKNAEEIEG